MKRLLTIITLFFIGCASPTITSNCDETADFNAYKTFMISPQPSEIITQHPEYDNPDNRAMIIKTITEELTDIGYTQVSDQADLLVNFDIVITEMVDPRVDSAVIYKPWVDTRIDSFNYTEGLLVIRLVDQEEGKLVWQGSLSGILEKKPLAFGHRLDKYTTKLFRSLKEHRQ